MPPDLSSWDSHVAAEVDRALVLSKSVNTDSENVDHPVAELANLKPMYDSKLLRHLLAKTATDEPMH